MSHNNFFKEPTRRQAKPQNPKGCCCKRSQCIKNYCDCYQSMTACSIYCKCIGCRNTEDRITSAVPAKKPPQAAKRERAMALSAKAAAAAAKEGNNIHMKPAPGSAIFTTTQQLHKKVVVPQLPIAAAIKLPDVDLDNVITLPPPNAGSQSTKKPLVVQPTINPLSTPPREVNVLNPPINAALLECVVIQAIEAEDFGFNEQQVGKLVFHEFTRNLQAVLKVYKRSQ